jgi:Transposase DDE domain
VDAVTIPGCRPPGARRPVSERAAAKRLVAQVRHDHPHLSLIVGMDGEFATGPMLKELAARDMGFILTAQDGDHTHLVQQVQAAQAAGKLTEVVRHDPVTGQEQRYRYVNDLELNETHPDLKVNYLEYRQDDGEQEHRWTWVTHLRLGKGTVTTVMRGGRARWKIENETFNTLKNQGYHYEHNYGHGKEHLSGVLATLMLLAFLVDQVQQASCPLFQAVWAKLKSKRALWEKIRSLFETMLLSSWQQLYEALLYGFERYPPVILTDTS